jgi:hypothetical protein
LDLLRVAILRFLKTLATPREYMRCAQRIVALSGGGTSLAVGNTVAKLEGKTIHMSPIPRLHLNALGDHSDGR